jgi:hypothetical protein
VRRLADAHSFDLAEATAPKNTVEQEGVRNFV